MTSPSSDSFRGNDRYQVSYDVFVPIPSDKDVARFVASRIRELYPLREEGGQYSFQDIADALGTNKPQVHNLLKLGKGWGKKLERLVAEKHFGGSIDRLHREAGEWLSSPAGRAEAPLPDPLAVQFLRDVERLPGLHAWLETREAAKLTTRQVARVVDVYAQTPPRSRGDGQPLDGWGAFCRDALSGRLTTATVGDQAAAEALERKQLPAATRKKLRSAPKKP